MSLSPPLTKILINLILASHLLPSAFRSQNSMDLASIEPPCAILPDQDNHHLGFFCSWKCGLLGLVRSPEIIMPHFTGVEIEYELQWTHDSSLCPFHVVNPSSTIPASTQNCLDYILCAPNSLLAMIEVKYLEKNFNWSIFSIICCHPEITMP